MKRLISLVSAILPILFTVAPLSPVFATIDIDISGNGNSSQNTVSVNADKTTEVTQTNTADVHNVVVQNANTGTNVITKTTGDVAQITSGNATVQTNVANDVNHSQVDASCCASSVDITVSGNGVDSINTVNTNISTTTNVNTTQVADVSNQIHVNANTGENTVNDTAGGKVEIDTGAIGASGQLVNKVNQTIVNVGQGGGNITIANTDNGASSVNTINFNLLHEVNILRNDVKYVNNSVYANLNTGSNNIVDNLNDILIKTGNVDFSFNVSNDPVNTGGADVLCCEDGTPVPTPGGHPQPGTIPPSTGGSNNGSGGSSSGGDGGSSANAGQVLGALTQILPATGVAAFHFWIMAVVYLLTFLSGLYLRLRAGRNPTHFYGYRLLTY